MNVSREALIDEVQTLLARTEKAEAEVERLEALAAGQAATIERVRQWAESPQGLGGRSSTGPRNELLAILEEKTNDLP